MDIRQCICEAAADIRRRYAEPLTVPDIAARAYLSPSYFSSVFRVLTGYTVGDYLNRYRLYRAAADLLDGGKPIVEIAYTHGFSSQQAFTRSFSQRYGIAPAQFRLSRPALDPFPPNTLWKEQVMELTDCFRDVKYMHKEGFYVAGVEVDINYNVEGGTDPIGSAWKIWNGENLTKVIPDQTQPGVAYGITHSETAVNTGKYIVCAEVRTLDNLPVGLVGRRFSACDYAVFDTTLAIIWTGFWRAFYTKWLPESGYAQPDASLHATYCTFNKYPAIEVYDGDNQNHPDEQSVMHIYAPIVKK